MVITTVHDLWMIHAGCGFHFFLAVFVERGTQVLNPHILGQPIWSLLKQLDYHPLLIDTKKQYSLLVIVKDKIAHDHHSSRYYLAIILRDHKLIHDH